MVIPHDKFVVIEIKKILENDLFFWNHINQHEYKEYISNNLAHVF